MSSMKTKDFALQVKAVDEIAGTFEGYASVYGVRDSYNEVVLPGAFVESLARHRREGTKPLMLWQHNPDEPVGVWDDLAEDSKGLWGRGVLLKGVRRADEAAIMLKAGAVQGLSIGYREIDTEPAQNGEPRKLVKLDLLEVSIVSFPANRRARIDAVKQALVDGTLPSLPEFERFLREAGFSKTQAAAIANRGLSHLLRSESEGAASETLARLSAAAKAFSTT